MYETKIEDVYEGFSSDKKIFDFSNYLTNWTYYDNSNKLFIGKIKDETRGVAWRVSCGEAKNEFILSQ